MPALRIYEINTFVWLAELRTQGGGAVDLGSVPAEVWDGLAGLGFDAIWLMGVWERSPAGVAIANENAELTGEFRRVLPDYRGEDNVGSAYCVRRYVVDQRLGGPAGLAAARNELAQRGMRLLLDWVPNHMAPDSPWIIKHPEHFIQGSAEELRLDPAAYVQIGAKIFARGRDPYFPPWPDVVQVNAFAPGFRAAVIELILGIAQQCDGIRCDMAMLLLNDIFARTWGAIAGAAPATEFWPEVIGAVRRARSHFLFIAEAYWELEWALQQQGFDFCYDKRLYDLLDHGDADGVRRHLGADLIYQQKLIRFIENHDEPRAAAVFSAGKERAAAITIATIPGAQLFHEGQLEGRRVRVPVFLRRRPQETADGALLGFYRQLLFAVNQPVLREGEWELCPCSGWPDNQSWRGLGAWCWTLGLERRLVVVNLTAGPLQARVQLPWTDLRGVVWRLDDQLSDASYDRDGTEMGNEGLYVELASWSGQILSFHAIS